MKTTGRMLLAVALAAGFAQAKSVDVTVSADGPRRAYTSLLRVGEHVLYDAQAERELWEAIDARPGAFDELTIFSQNTHSVRTLACHREQAPRVERFLREAERHGLKAGVNILATIGFTEDGHDPETDALPRAVRSSDGKFVGGRLCRTAPETLAYVRELYAIYAATKPAFIYMDDDITAAPCQCPRCCRAAVGAKDLKELQGRFVSDDLAVRRETLAHWLAFAEDAVDGVCAAAAKGTHGVDPKIGLGLMTFSLGWIGHNPARWARTFADGGDLSSVRWRPGGGNHNDYSFQALVRKTLGVSMQVEGLPPEVTLVQGEIENFPFQTLRKTPGYMNYEALLLMAAGCTGIAWDISGFNARDPIENAPFFDAIRDVRSAAERVLAACGRTPCAGIGFPAAGHADFRLDAKNWQGAIDGFPMPADFAAIGLPVASDGRRAEVTLLDRAAVMALSDDDLRRVLSDAAFLDAEALAEANARGFGKLTGFRVAGEALDGVIMRDLENPLNVSGRYVRDLRRCFGHTGPVAPIMRTDERAQYTSEAVTTIGEPTGNFIGGVYENAEGGRVAVETMRPFSWCESRARTIHLKRLLVWLSRGALPAYVASFHRAMAFCRGEAVFVANLANEPMRNAEVVAKGPEQRRITVFGGGRIVAERTVLGVHREGTSFVFLLPDVPVNGEALLERVGGAQK